MLRTFCSLGIRSESTEILKTSYDSPAHDADLLARSHIVDLAIGVRASNLATEARLEICHGGPFLKRRLKLEQSFFLFVGE